MGGTLFVAISLYLGWLLSPEALVITSNLAGKGGMSCVVLIFAASLLSYLGLLLARYQSRDSDPTVIEATVLQSFSITAAVCLSVFLPTGMLVAAGFTFNETFVYWFPNFGFSALLLAVILLIHLTGEKAIRFAQQLFSTTALLGLSIIILVGILSPVTNTPTAIEATQNPNYLHIFTLSLLLFLGAWHTSLKKLSPIQLFFMLLGGALLLSLWQIVAITYVPAAKLGTSTIPYILVAREVMGQAGRILIGITIISGTCAAVNFFFSLASRQISHLLSSVIPHEKGEAIARRVIALLLTATVGICMAKGLAGEPHLETYIRASLLLWFLSATAQILSQWLHTRKILHIFLPLLFIFTALYLIMAHEEVTSLVIFTALALCLGFIITTATVLLGKRVNQQQL